MKVFSPQINSNPAYPFVGDYDDYAEIHLAFDLTGSGSLSISPYERYYRTIYVIKKGINGEDSISLDADPNYPGQVIEIYATPDGDLICSSPAAFFDGSTSITIPAGSCVRFKYIQQFNQTVAAFVWAKL